MPPMRSTNASPCAVDLEVVVRDPAAERLDLELAARPDARRDLLRLHPAILDWPRMTFARCSSTSTAPFPKTSRSLFAIFEELFASSGASRSPRPSTTTQLAGLSDPGGRGDLAREARARRSSLGRSSSTGSSLLTARTVLSGRSRRPCWMRPTASQWRSSRAPRAPRSSPCSKRLGSPRRSAALVAAEDVERGKPAPDGYLRALELLGIGRARPSPSRTPTSGSPPPRPRGLRCVAVTGTLPTRPARPPADEIIERLDPDFVAASAGVGFTRAERQGARAGSRRTARSTRSSSRSRTCRAG